MSKVPVLCLWAASCLGSVAWMFWCWNDPAHFSMSDYSHYRLPTSEDQSAMVMFMLARCLVASATATWALEKADAR